MPEILRRRLPPGWSADLENLRSADSNSLLKIRAPNGRRASLEVFFRKQVLPRDVAHLMGQLGGKRERMLMAPFLSPRARELLTSANASYADATGNLRLVVREPAVFLEGRGADRDPQKRTRPLRSLRGAAAGRVVRGLCDFLPPYGVRTLALRSATPLGTVSRVVTFLEDEALLSRDGKKSITAVDWAGLIGRWTNDYSVATSNLMRPFIDPRGIGSMVAKVTKLRRYAVTGSLAVTDSVAPARLAMIYVDDADEAARVLDLTPTDTGANVWLLEPYDSVVFERTQYAKAMSEASAMVTVAPSQIAADLLTSPGRGPQEADALIDRMKGTENAWRTKP